MLATLTALLGTALAMQTAGPAATVPAGPVPRRIEAFLELCETSRRGAIARLEHQLRGLQAQRPAANTSRQIARVEADLATLRSNKEPVVPALRFPAETGDIGRLPRLTCHVDQVLSDDEMLVTATFALKVRTVQNFKPRLETVDRPVRFLMRGVSSDQTHAGADMQLLDVFQIAGSHTYRTVSGKSVTVQVLSPFDMQTVMPYFRQKVGQ